MRILIIHLTTNKKICSANIILTLSARSLRVFLPIIYLVITPTPNPPGPICAPRAEPN